MTGPLGSGSCSGSQYSGCGRFAVLLRFMWLVVPRRLQMVLIRKGLRKDVLLSYPNLLLKAHDISG